MEREKKPVRPIYRGMAVCVYGTVACLIFAPFIAPFFTLPLIPLSFIAMYGERKRYIQQRDKRGEAK